MSVRDLPCSAVRLVIKFGTRETDRARTLLPRSQGTGHRTDSARGTAAAQSTLDRAVRPAGLYRVREAALMVGLNPETIRRRIRRGEIRAWGRPQKIALDDLLPIYLPEACRK